MSWRDLLRGCDQAAVLGCHVMHVDPVFGVEMEGGLEAV